MSTVEFGSLFEFIRNGMNVKQDKSGAGLPISRIETISNSTIDPSRVGFSNLTENDCSGWLLERGDLLFSHINSVEHIGKCAVYRGNPEKLVHGMNLLCLRPEPSKLDAEFAKYLLRGQAFKTRLANFVNKAVNQASVSIGNLRGIPVSVPALPEQRRLAAILDQAETLRSQRRAALTQFDSLTQSLFLDMFGDPSAEITKWQKVELAGVAELVTGYPFKSEEYVGPDEGIRLCRGVNVLPGRLDWRDTACWPNDKVSGLETFRLSTGDIVMAMDRPWISEGFKLAQISSEDSPMLLVQRVARIRAQESATNEFLFWVLSHVAFTRHCKPTETTIPHISPKVIRSFKFPLPPFALQQTFATRIQAIEALKASQRAALAELDALFAALQQRAFSGNL